MKTLCFMIISFSAVAADIEYSGKISIAEYEAKTVRSSWRIFSDGDSRTYTSEISSKGSGNEGALYETFSHRGRQYLKRKVEWKNEQNANSMVLRFESGDANFSGHQEYDKKTCSYKTWKGNSTAAENVLTARAAFSVPRNVWAIKVTSTTESLYGASTLILSNDDYVLTEKGEEIGKKELSTFGNNKVGRYFIVNPSIEGKENFVYLDFVYIAKTLHANKFNLSFKVEFLAAEQCLSQLDGLNFSDMLERSITGLKLDDSLINLACMLNTSYVKHNLGIMHINGLPELFRKLRDVERKTEALINSESTSKDLESLNIILKLIDKVRFYYSYEILKETMSMLKHNVSYQGKTLDSVMYMEVLRKRGVLYLAEVFDNLHNTIDKIKSSENPIIEISENDALKFDVFLKTLLPLEFRGFERSHALIFRPEYLSSYAFNNLDLSVKRVLVQWNSILDLSQKLFLNREISQTQIARFEDELREMIDTLRFYQQQIEIFKLSSGDVEIDPLLARRHILNQIESLYVINLKSLVGVVNTYFYKHFEDPEFRNIRVGDKTYSHVSEFILDFENLLKEVE